MGAVDATAGPGSGSDELEGAVARLIELTTLLAARVERSEQRLEGAIRTELVSLRRGLRATSDEIAAGLDRSTDTLRAEVRSAVESEIGDPAAVLARIDALERLVREADARAEARLEQALDRDRRRGLAPGDDSGRTLRAELVGMRQTMRAALGELDAATRASAVELVTRVERLEGAAAALPPALSHAVEAALLQGWPESIGSALTQMSGDLQGVVADLLTEQLAVIDQRQSVIEDGLRAMWHRLDDLEAAMAQAEATPAATAPGPPAELVAP